MERDFNQAIKYAEKAYQDAINSGSSVYQERTTFALAFCHQELKDYSNALKFYLEAEKIALDLGLKERLIYTYTQLSILYLDQGKLKLSEDNCRLALKYAEIENNSIYITAALNHLGILNLRYHRFDQALSNFNASLDYRLKHNFNFNINYVKANIAFCYKKLSDTDRANAIYREIGEAYQRGEFQKCSEELLATIRTSLESEE